MDLSHAFHVRFIVSHRRNKNTEERQPSAAMTMLHQLGVDKKKADAYAQLSFDLSHDTVVSVKIEDREHNIVQVLMEGLMHVGHHDVRWFGRTRRGENVFIVLDTPTDHRVARGQSLTRGHEHEGPSNIQETRTVAPPA